MVVNEKRVNVFNSAYFLIIYLYLLYNENNNHSVKENRANKIHIQTSLDVMAGGHNNIPQSIGIHSN